MQNGSSAEFTSRRKWGPETQAGLQVLEEIRNGVEQPDGGEGKKRRRSRWAPEVRSELPGVPGIALPASIMALVQTIDTETMQLQQKLARVNQALQLVSQGIWVDDVDPADRSPSPRPIYDAAGVRTNTRKLRMREKLLQERNDMITTLLQTCPTYKAPPDWRPPKKSERLYIPVKENPGYNFIGLIIGPRGTTQKEMEKKTGAKIAIRGRGSVKEGRQRKEGRREEDEDESLHVLITADTQQAVDEAAALIRPLLDPVDESQNEHKRQQLRELALMNGTLRDGLAEDKVGLHLGESRDGDVYRLPTAVHDAAQEQYQRDVARVHGAEHAVPDNEYKAFLAEMGGNGPPGADLPAPPPRAPQAGAPRPDYDAGASQSFHGQSAPWQNHDHYHHPATALPGPPPWAPPPHAPLPHAHMPLPNHWHSAQPESEAPPGVDLADAPDTSAAADMPFIGPSVPQAPVPPVPLPPPPLQFPPLTAQPPPGAHMQPYPAHASAQLNSAPTGDDDLPPGADELPVGADVHVGAAQLEAVQSVAEDVSGQAASQALYMQSSNAEQPPPRDEAAFAKTQAEKRKAAQRERAREEQKEAEESRRSRLLAAAAAAAVQSAPPPPVIRKQPPPPKAPKKPVKEVKPEPSESGEVVGSDSDNDDAASKPNTGAQGRQAWRPADNRRGGASGDGFAYGDDRRQGWDRGATRGGAAMRSERSGGWY